ncbi:MAG: tetratricopeptide repeat protein, partial [Chloroflexia bacterium]
LATSDRRTAARAWASRSAGTLASNQSDYGRARVLLQEALDIYEELGELVEIARTLNNFGLVEWAQMNIELARDYFTRALANNRIVGEKWGIAASLSNLGMLEDTMDSRGYLQEAYSLFLELGDKSSASTALNNLGVTAHREGNLEEAQRLWEDCVALYREINNRQSLGLALTNLAVVARDRGNYDEARKLNREGLALSQAIGDVRIIGQVLIRMGGMASMEENYEKSARLFGAAHRLMSEWKVVSPPSSKKDQDLYEGKAREELGEARYDEMWREGRRLSVEEAIEIGLTKGPD